MIQNVVTPLCATAPTAPIESRPSPRAPASHAFATLLKQSQAVKPEPAKAEPVKPTRSDVEGPGQGTDGTDAPTTPAPASPSGSAKQPDARRVEDAKPSARRGDAKPAEGDDSTADAETATKDDPAVVAAPSDALGTGVPLTHGLVAQHRLATATATADGASPGKGTDSIRSTPSGPSDRKVDGDAATASDVSSTPAQASRGAAVDDRGSEPRTLARFELGTSGKIAYATGDASPGGATTPLAPTAGRTESTSPATPAHAVATPDFAPASSTASVDAAVATPLASPDFAQAFAVQVSVLVKDGVQRAELHLNPVETGPVSVQIVVDGNQARIDFGADALATRQAIEAGLPELAGALREAGMTLQGGGVSQHARDPNAEARPGDGAPSTRSLRRDDDGVPATVVRPRTVAAGGVDLYA